MGLVTAIGPTGNLSAQPSEVLVAYFLDISRELEKLRHEYGRKGIRAARLRVYLKNPELITQELADLEASMRAIARARAALEQVCAEIEYELLSRSLTKEKLCTP